MNLKDTRDRDHFKMSKEALGMSVPCRNAIKHLHIRMIKCLEICQILIHMSMNTIFLKPHVRTRVSQFTSVDLPAVIWRLCAASY